MQKNKLKLHTKPKQPIQLNRPLIMAISIAITAILLFTIVAALTSSDNSTKSTKTNIKVDTNKTAVNPELKGLPEGYQDVAGIKKFLSGPENPQLSILIQKFGQLQSQYAALKKELANKRDTIPKPHFNPSDQKAKTSELIFGEISTSADSLIGSGASSAKNRIRNNKNNDENIVPTPEQGEFIRQQERNKQKLAVMKGKDRPEEIYDLHNIITPVSPYQIQAGTLIPATLITGVDTSLAGTLIAQISANVYDTVTGKYLLIPKGSKLLGQYDSRRILNGQSRILLVFDRIVRPDGSSILIGNPSAPSIGVDSTGKSGLEGDVNNHWGRVLGTATISTILSAGAGMAAGSSYDNSSNPSQRAYGAAGTRVANIGNDMVRKASNIRPTITLPPGHQFHVAVRRDMVLTPYKPNGY